VIRIEGLTKRFGDRVAVEDLTLDVRRGEIVALLGPNGAGKTTTVRMLLGLVRPTSGTATVAGVDPTRDARRIREVAGLLAESPGCYGRLTARQNLAFFGTLHGLAPERLATRIEESLRRFDLWDRRDDRFGTFSRGMRQKLALARTLLHEPEVLFLDEPTAALAPEARVGVRDLLVALREAGRTVLLCTHDLDEASRIATRVAILKTRLLAFDTPEALIRASGRRTTRLRVTPQDGSILDRLRALPFVRRADRLGSAEASSPSRPVAPAQTPGAPSAVTYRLELTDPERDAPELVRRLVEAGHAVLELRDETPTLERIYLETIR